MRLTVTIAMDGAAFHDPYTGAMDAVPELQRIMTEAAGRLDSIGVEHAPGELFTIRDINGHTVGAVTLSDT